MIESRHRATFYTHYTDKDDLLNHIVTDLIDELQERQRPLVSTSSVGFTGKPILEMFRHAAEERDTYRVILRGEGDGRALRRFIDDRAAIAAVVFAARAEAQGATSNIDIDLLARAWVGERITVLQWWLEPETPTMSPEEVTNMLRDLSLRGRFRASGFEGEAPA
ncbi:TetR/AcrR family transcriptional regulator [Nocardia sp. NPDC004568]|uniref:TetR/AcrR family transcriptional regulator n=1 Tax=Nocardia sp. NPDC004568 TaxID=3154551 RepID=UPI0033B81961